MVGVFIHIDAHAQNHHALGLHTILHCDEGRKLFDTRGTPSRPEVQDHDLSTKLLQVNFSVGVLHAEVVGGIPNVRRTRTAQAARLEQDRRDRHEKKKSLHALESLQDIRDQRARKILREAAERGGVFFEKAAEIL